MAPSEYLVNYGKAGFLGRFQNRAGIVVDHGDRVVIKSGRGREIGTALAQSSPNFSHLVGPEVAGELLRRMTPDDECRASENQLTAERILLDARAMVDAEALPMTILDVEILLDRDLAILQILPLGECNASALCSELSARHSLTCSLQPLLENPFRETESSGCGKPGCGSSGGCTSGCGAGGCSTGSCSRGSIKNADELTAYFAGLRKQMEGQFGRMPLGAG